jgi:hypothetical protein
MSATKRLQISCYQQANREQRIQANVAAHLEESFKRILLISSTGKAARRGCVCVQGLCEGE